MLNVNGKQLKKFRALLMHQNRLVKTSLRLLLDCKRSFYIDPQVYLAQSLHPWRPHQSSQPSQEHHHLHRHLKWRQMLGHRLFIQVIPDCVPSSAWSPFSSSSDPGTDVASFFKCVNDSCPNWFRIPGNSSVICLFSACPVTAKVLEANEAWT